MAHTEDLDVDGPLTVNKFTGDTATFLTSTGGWSATNSVLSVDFDFKKYTSLNSLKVTPTDYNSIVLSNQEENTSLDEVRDSIDFHCWVFPLNDCLATVVIALVGGGSSTRSVSLPGGVWSILRGTPMAVPTSSETYPIALSITFSNHGGQTIHMSNPTLYQEFRFTKNRFVQECVPMTPRIFTDLDKQQTLPSFPMYRMMEIGLANAGAAFHQQEHFRYRDISTGGDPTNAETLSGLVNPEVADVAYLPWLSQFTGTQYIDPTIKTTPWGNLPSTWEDVMQDIDDAVDIVLDVVSLTRTANTVTAVLDGDVTSFAPGETVRVVGSGTFNGQFIISDQNIVASTLEWGQGLADETTTSGTVSLVDQSWIEIESFRLDITNRIEFLRWQVENQYFGMRAGTLEALVETTKFYLTGNKTVNVFSKHQGVPFLIKIFTKTSETPGGIEGEESAELVQALQAAKPAGFKIVHECNSAGSDSLFVLGSSTEGLLSSSLL